MHRFTLRSPVAASLKFTLLPDRLTDLVGFIFSRSAPLPSAPLLSAWCEPGFSRRWTLRRQPAGHRAGVILLSVSTVTLYFHSPRNYPAYYVWVISLATLMSSKAVLILSFAILVSRCNMELSITDSVLCQTCYAMPVILRTPPAGV